MKTCRFCKHWTPRPDIAGSMSTGTSRIGVCGRFKVIGGESAKLNGLHRVEAGGTLTTRLDFGCVEYEGSM